MRPGVDIASTWIKQCTNISSDFLNVNVVQFEDNRAENGSDWVLNLLMVCSLCNACELLTDFPGPWPNDFGAAPAA